MNSAGGIVIFMTAIFSNVTATCPSGKRKGRFLMIQFFMFLPIVIAVSLGGYIKERLGVLALASVVGSGYAITLTLLLFIYKDTGDQFCSTCFLDRISRYTHREKNSSSPDLPQKLFSKPPFDTSTIFPPF